MRWVLSFLWCMALISAATADTTAQDVYQFNNPVLEERFQTLTHLLRCPKCQDQSIGDSDAEIASDMRRRTAELLREGKSNDEIVNYFIERYGDFVTFKPPLRWDTALVWSMPLLIFLLGSLLVVWQLVKANRRWRNGSQDGKGGEG